MGFGKSAKKTYMRLKKKAYGERGVKGRYYRVGAVKGLQNLAKDIDMIKSRLNVEKKHKDVDVSTFAAGQANQNADGYNWFDVTPDVTQGIQTDQRIGASMKLTGFSFPLQFSQQAGCLGNRKVRISLLKVVSADNGVSGPDAVEDYWDTNPLNGLRDFNAPLAYRTRRTDGIKCIRSMVVHVPGPLTDSASTGLVDDTEVNPKDARFNVKLQDILRFAQPSDTKPDGVRYYLIFQTDAGNRNVLAPTTVLDIPIKSATTGLYVRLGQRSWWVDN